MILFVCTGNICRSPAAERLLARAGGAELTVGSAGTSALVGQPIAPPMAELIVAAGAEVAGFQARQVSSPMLRQAGLVLTMTREHRGEVVDLWPGVVRRCFTLLEFTRLCSTVPRTAMPSGPLVDRLPQVVGLAAAQRRPLGASASGDDIADPYRRASEAYQSAFGAISTAVSAVVRVLGDPTATAR